MYGWWTDIYVRQNRFTTHELLLRRCFLLREHDLSEQTDPGDFAGDDDGGDTAHDETRT